MFELVYLRVRRTATRIATRTAERTAESCHVTVTAFCDILHDICHGHLCDILHDICHVDKPSSVELHTVALGQVFCVFAMLLVEEEWTQSWNVCCNPAIALILQEALNDASFRHGPLQYSLIQ